MKLIRAWILWAFLPIFLGCVPEREISLPDELVGLWKTSAPSYADRYFEFTKKMLIFKVGKEEIGIHEIKDIEKFGDGKETRYTVTYMSLGDKYKFSFSYDPANDGMIALSNRTGIQWTREETVKGESET
jgi:hypothetical protein